MPDKPKPPELPPIRAVTVQPPPSQLKPAATHLHDCFGNAARVVYANYDCAYIEGFVDLGDGGEPVAHAWNERDGVHFDVTGVLIDTIAAKHKAPSRFVDCPHYPVLRVTYSALKKACNNQVYSHDHLRRLRRKAQALSDAVLVKLQGHARKSEVTVPAKPKTPKSLPKPTKLLAAERDAVRQACGKSLLVVAALRRHALGHVPLTAETANTLAAELEGAARELNNKLGPKSDWPLSEPSTQSSNGHV